VSKTGILREFLVFLWARKLFWLAPIIVLLLLFGALAIFVQSPAVAPLIYALF
jgi:hypothetical protein